MRQLNVPSGMQSVSAVFCWVLARIELGTANWTGGTSVFLCTRCPAWQEMAWQTLMCFPGSLKGNKTPTPPESQGWFPLQLKMPQRFLFFIKLSATVLLTRGAREARVEGKGERRTTTERRKRRNGQSSFLWWSGRWWEEEHCWFILTERKRPADTADTKTFFSSPPLPLSLYSSITLGTLNLL